MLSLPVILYIPRRYHLPQIPCWRRKKTVERRKTAKIKTFSTRERVAKISIWRPVYSLGLKLKALWVKTVPVFLLGHDILGDPGADSGGKGKSKRAEKYDTKKRKERREELFSPFFTFLLCHIFPPV